MGFYRFLRNFPGQIEGCGGKGPLRYTFHVLAEKNPTGLYRTVQCATKEVTQSHLLSIKVAPKDF